MAETPYPLPKSTRQTDWLVGDGSTRYGPFAEGWGIFDTGDVLVETRPAAGGAKGVVECVIEKASSARYAPFYVTFPTVITSATEYRITGLRQHERDLAVTRGGAVDGVNLELELSKQAVVLQEQRRDVDAAVPPGVLANAIYGYDGDGDPMAYPLASLLTGSFDAKGPFAGRALYDAQPEGFTYLVTDQRPLVLYMRNGAAGGWLGPFIFADDVKARGFSFATRADLQLAHIPAVIDVLEVRGHTTEWVGQARYKRTTTPGVVLPEHCQSADGAWWVIAPDMPFYEPAQFGAALPATWSGSSITGPDSTAAVLAMAAFVNGLYVKTKVPFYIGGSPRVKFSYIGSDGGYKVTSAVQIEGGVDVLFEAPLLFDIAANGAIIGLEALDTYGASSPSNSARWMRWTDVWLIRRAYSDWTNATDVGLKINSAYVPHVTVKLISGFRDGIINAASYGFLDWGEVYGAEYGVTHRNLGLANQFANSMLYTGKEISVGGLNFGKSRYGFRIVGDAPYGINTVRVTGTPSFELGLVAAQTANPAGEAIPFVLDGSAGASAVIQDFYADGCRSEGNGPILVKRIGYVSNTHIEFLHCEDAGLYPDADAYLDIGVIGTNNTVRRMGGVNSGDFKTTWKSDRFARNAVAWSAGANMAIRGLDVMVEASPISNPPTYRAYSTGSWAAFGADGDLAGFTYGEVFIRRVKLNGEKTLGLQITRKRGELVDMVFKCFDKTGAALTAANKVFVGYAPVPTSTRFGGSHIGGVVPVLSGTAGDEVCTEIAIGFASDVDTVYIGFVNGFEVNILSPLGMANSWAESELLGSGGFIAAAQPAAATGISYFIGQDVANAVPAVGQPKSWLCTATTPTFVSTGNL